MVKHRKDRSVNNKFGATLKYWREKKGLSQQKLFDVTGVSISYISRLESGKRKAPSVPISFKIADALGIPPSLLLDILGKDEKESFIQILEFILELSWDEYNKVRQLFDLSKLINDFKEVSK